MKLGAQPGLVGAPQFRSDRQAVRGDRRVMGFLRRHQHPRRQGQGAVSVPRHHRELPDTGHDRLQLGRSGVRLEDRARTIWRHPFPRRRYRRRALGDQLRMDGAEGHQQQVLRGQADLEGWRRGLHPVLGGAATSARRPRRSPTWFRPSATWPMPTSISPTMPAVRSCWSIACRSCSSRTCSCRSIVNTAARSTTPIPTAAASACRRGCGRS